MVSFKEQYESLCTAENYEQLEEVFDHCRTVKDLDVSMMFENRNLKVYVFFV